MSEVNYKNNQNQKESRTLDFFKKKVENIYELEREFWEEIRKNRDYIKENTPEINEEIEEFFPYNLSSKIYGFNDGIIFVRYLSPDSKIHFEYNFLEYNLENASDHVIIPTNMGNVLFLKTINAGPGTSIRIRETGFGDLKIDWLWISCYSYNDNILMEKFEEALFDFKTYITAILIDPNFKPIGNVNQEKENILQKFEELKNNFENLLNKAQKEEEVQTFLKEHTMLIQHHSEKISKQKLGDNWITDFVLLNTLEQGSKYTFVEIEKPSMRILTKKNQFTEEFNHAQKQILDWEIWLQQDQAYICNRLKDFETPNFIIIGGRAINLNEQEKKYIRSYNRMHHNLTFYTYDDLISNFNILINNLKKELGIQISNRAEDGKMGDGILPPQARNG